MKADSEGLTQPAFKESVIELALMKAMSLLEEATGEGFQTQVVCDIGIIDMVSESTIIEVKRTLDRSSIIRAIGQLEIYSVFYPNRQKMICGLSHPDAVCFTPVCERLGIKIEAFEEFEIASYLQHL